MHNFSIMKACHIPCLLDGIHDWYFDVEKIGYNQESRTVTVFLVPTKQDIPALNNYVKLEIFNVKNIEIQDTEKIGYYCLNTVKYNEVSKTIQIYCDVPLKIKIFTDGLKIEASSEEESPVLLEMEARCKAQFIDQCLHKTRHNLLQGVRDSLKDALDVPSPFGSWRRIIAHSTICGIIFWLMTQGAVAEVEKDNWEAARLWGMGALGVPLCYTFASLIFILLQPRPRMPHKRETPARRLKTPAQIFVERKLQRKENRDVKAAIKRGFLMPPERFQKIKFPVTGVKGGVVKIFDCCEDTSFLLADGLSEWFFYDADNRLVQPRIVPPLIGWHERTRHHPWGKYLIDIPKNEWVWFHLKHPVEPCHKTGNDCS